MMARMEVDILVEWNSVIKNTRNFYISKLFLASKKGFNIVSGISLTDLLLLVVASELWLIQNVSVVKMASFKTFGFRFTLCPCLVAFTRNQALRKHTHFCNTKNTCRDMRFKIWNKCRESNEISNYNIMTSSVFGIFLQGCHWKPTEMRKKPRWLLAVKCIKRSGQFVY